MVVRIRLKKLGRRHRPFYRVCAMDGHAPRNGKVIEELGHYDPMIRDTDARAVLNGERIAYWLSVGAQPTEKVGVLIKKYGAEGTHLEKQQAALERLKTEKRRMKLRLMWLLLKKLRLKKLQLKRLRLKNRRKRRMGSAECVLMC